jgi:VWFA-related protein
MEIQRLTRFIRILRNQSTPIQQRLDALDRLKNSDDPEVLIAIANACLATSPSISEKSREIISDLSFGQLASLINFLLTQASAGHFGRKVFGVLYELKNREIFRYIVEFALNTQEEDPNRKTIASWMKDLNIFDNYVRAMLNLPSAKDSTPSTLALALGKALKKIDESTITSTARLIKQTPTHISLRGLGILEEIAEGSDISQLLLALRDTEDEKVRSKATKTMVKLSKSVRMIKDALRDKDARVRANALELLWHPENDEIKKEALSLAEPHLREPNNRARANAARVFYEAKDSLGFDTLMEMLDSHDERMRASAAWILGDVKEASATEKLRQLAKDDSSELVVKNAEQALDKMDLWAIQVANLLKSLQEFTLSDPNTGLPTDTNYVAMMESLRERDFQELVEMVQEIQQTSPDICMQMIKALENTTDEGATVALLLAAAYSKDGRVRSKAALLIGRICNNENVFRHFLADSDLLVRANAVEALEECSEPFVVPMLVNCLKSTNNRILVNAAKALGQREDLRGWRTLLVNLRDPDPAFRASCVWALGEIGKPDIVGQLELLKQDPDKNVKRNVRIALDKIAQRNRESPSDILAKIRHVDVSQHPEVDCYISVESAEGPITGLNTDNFIVKENNVTLPFEPSSQEKAAQHLSLAILMDYSLSMGEQDLQSMETAIDQLIDALDEADQVAIIKFSSRVSVDQELTTDREAISAAVHNPHTDNEGGTLLYDAIYSATQLLRPSGGLKSIIVLTDGEDSDSDIEIAQVVGAASGQHNTIYTIGLGDNLDLESLTQIAESTSGRFFSATDPNALLDIYQQISRALHSHYVLTFQSQSTRVRGVNLLAIEVNYGDASSRDTIPLPKVS